LNQIALGDWVRLKWTEGRQIPKKYNNKWAKVIEFTSKGNLVVEVFTSVFEKLVVNPAKDIAQHLKHSPITTVKWLRKIRPIACHDPKEMIVLGQGGLGATKSWYSGYYCSKCKRLYAETDDGRHFHQLKKDTQKLLSQIDGIRYDMMFGETIVWKAGITVEVERL
jgi:hypothetical protein